MACKVLHYRWPDASNPPLAMVSPSCDHVEISLTTILAVFCYTGKTRTRTTMFSLRKQCLMCICKTFNKMIFNLHCFMGRKLPSIKSNHLARYYVLAKYMIRRTLTDASLGSERSASTSALERNRRGQKRDQETSEYEHLWLSKKHGCIFSFSTVT